MPNATELKAVCQQVSFWTINKLLDLEVDGPSKIVRGLEKMLPSQLSAFKRYPAVYEFVSKHVDMQFNDVRGMLKLPLPTAGIDAGCNFATTAMLCNLISGISVILYTPKSKKRDSGTKFKELLRNFYSWERGESKGEKAKIIYKFARNPLAHSLGTLEKNSLPVSILKSPLSETQIEEIEHSVTRPTWVPLAVTGDSTRYDFSVAGLYWGVFHLVGSLAKDTGHMQQAEQRLMDFDSR